MSQWLHLTAMSNAVDASSRGSQWYWFNLIGQQKRGRPIEHHVNRRWPTICWCTWSSHNSILFIPIMRVRYILHKYSPFFLPISRALRTRICSYKILPKHWQGQNNWNEDYLSCKSVSSVTFQSFSTNQTIIWAIWIQAHSSFAGECSKDPAVAPGLYHST